MSPNPYIQRRDDYGNLLDWPVHERLLHELHELGSIPGINTTHAAALAAELVGEWRAEAIERTHERDEAIRRHNEAAGAIEELTKARNRLTEERDRSRAHEADLVRMVNDWRAEAIGSKATGGSRAARLVKLIAGRDREELS